MLKAIATGAMLAIGLFVSSGEAYAGHCRSGTSKERIRCLNNEVAYLTTKYKQAEENILDLTGQLATTNESLATLTTAHGDLVKRHDELAEKVDTMATSVNGSVKYGTHLKMRSLKWDNKCLSQTGADTASAENCDTAPKWFLFD